MSTLKEGKARAGIAAGIAREEPKGWRDVPSGGLVTEAGNAMEYETGDWRTFRPVWHQDRCIQCLFCWVYCPDSAVEVRDGKVVGIDYKHCKGCGICANECPPKVRAIKMELESEAAGEGTEDTSGEGLEDTSREGAAGVGGGKDNA